MLNRAGDDVEQNVTGQSA